MIIKGTLEGPDPPATGRRTGLRRGLAGGMMALAIAGCAGAPRETAPPSAEIRAAVAAADRSEADRKTDLRRHPEQLLAFAGVRPGMKVLDDSGIDLIRADGFAEAARKAVAAAG